VIDYPTVEGKTSDDQLRSAEKFIAEFKNYSPRITPTVTPHAPYTTSGEWSAGTGFVWGSGGFRGLAGRCMP